MMHPTSGHGLKVREIVDDAGLLDEADIEKANWLGDHSHNAYLQVTVADDGGPAPNPVEIFADHTWLSVERTGWYDGRGAKAEYEIRHPQFA